MRCFYYFHHTCYCCICRLVFFCFQLKPTLLLISYYCLHCSFVIALGCTIPTSQAYHIMYHTRRQFNWLDFVYYCMSSFHNFYHIALLLHRLLSWHSSKHYRGFRLFPMPTLLPNRAWDVTCWYTVTVSRCTSKRVYESSIKRYIIRYTNSNCCFATKWGWS